MLAPGYSGFRGGFVGQVYNETAFRHFLAVDRWRAERARRSILLVLVAVRQTPGLNAKLSDAAAAALFSGLGACVREVDFMGWYREGYVAGAVLAQGNKASGKEAHLITERIAPGIRSRLAVSEATKLHVRVVRLGVRVAGMPPGRGPLQ